MMIAALLSLFGKYAKQNGGRHYIRFLPMVICVRSTGRTLSKVDHFVLEDDFCKFWFVFTCGSSFVYYTICWCKRFLDVQNTKIPNFEFICVDIC